VANTGHWVGFIVVIVAFLVFIAIAAGFGYWASAIAKKKGLSAGGFFALGFFFGAIGVIVAAVVGPASPPAPAGMRSVACPRCNARQNVAFGASGFECWQCRTSVPVPN
jgi:hypothetical protein